MDAHYEESDTLDALLNDAVEQDRNAVDTPCGGSDINCRNPPGNAPQIETLQNGEHAKSVVPEDGMNQLPFVNFSEIGPECPENHADEPSSHEDEPDAHEKGFSETGPTLESFSNLDAQLREIEAEFIGWVDFAVQEARDAMVAALGLYRTSRFHLGEALAEYKRQFTADRGWMAAAVSIAEAMGCDERTVRNIIADYERTASLPEAVIQAAQARGIDLAQRRYRPAVAAIESIIENDGHGQDAIDAEEANRIVSNVLVMPSPDQREHIQDDRFVKLTREEKQHFAIRMKIRTALTNVEPDEKLSAFIAALEEEMFAIWGQNEPVTVTITPRPSGFTLDGRKIKENAA